MTQVTEADIYEAALQWCGEKDRETSLDDIRYFQNNWSALPGLRRRVQAFARHREQAVQEAVAERDAGITALETWQRGILEWLAHECGIRPDELPNHLVLQEIDNAQSHS